MPTFINPYIITLDGTGTEIPTLSCNQLVSEYILHGNVITTGNYAIVPSGIPRIGTKFNFFFDGVINITTNSNTFSVFGKALTQTQLLTPQKVECVYLSSGWYVHIIPSFGDSGIIQESNFSTNCLPATAIPNDSITNLKLTTMSNSSIKYGNATGDPGDLVIGNNEIPIGNGTTIVAKSLEEAFIGSGLQMFVNVDLSATSSASAYRVQLPYINGRVTHIHTIAFIVCETLSGTDNMDIDVTTSEGNVTNYQNVTIPASSTPLTTISPGSLSDNYDLGANAWVRFTCQKATAGGKVMAIIHFEIQ